MDVVAGPVVLLGFVIFGWGFWIILDDLNEMMFGKWVRWREPEGTLADRARRAVVFLAIGGVLLLIGIAILDGRS